MADHFFVIAGVIGMLPVTPADEAPRVHGGPPRLFIASGIDADGNLILSGTVQRKKYALLEVERCGKKSMEQVAVSAPVTVLNRQSVSPKDAVIYDREGNKVSVEQARARLKEPTPVLVTMLGEKVDPIYLKIMT